MTLHTPSRPTISARRPAPLPLPVPFPPVPFVEFDPAPSPPATRPAEFSDAEGPEPPTRSIPLGVTPPWLPLLSVRFTLADVALTSPVAVGSLALAEIDPVGPAPPIMDGVHVVWQHCPFFVVVSASPLPSPPPPPFPSESAASPSPLPSTCRLLSASFGACVAELAELELEEAEVPPPPAAEVRIAPTSAGGDTCVTPTCSVVPPPLLSEGEPDEDAEVDADVGDGAEFTSWSQGAQVSTGNHVVEASEPAGVFSPSPVSVSFAAPFPDDASASPVHFTALPDVSPLLLVSPSSAG